MSDLTDGFWHGHTWRAVVTLPMLNVWAPIDVEPDEMFIEEVAAKLPAIAEIVGSSLPGQLADPIDVAVFPHETFLDDVGLNRDRLDWVTGCVRGDVFCCRAGALRRAHEGLGQIELAHELIHCALGPNDGRPAELVEGVAEALARFAIYRCRGDDESAKFYASLGLEELPTMQRLAGQDLMELDNRRPGENVAYASAALFVVGLSSQMSICLEDTVSEIHDADYRYDEIAARSGLSAETLLQSIQLQRVGHVQVEAVLASP